MFTAVGFLVDYLQHVHTVSAVIYVSLDAIVGVLGISAMFCPKHNYSKCYVLLLHSIY